MFTKLIDKILINRLRKSPTRQVITIDFGNVNSEEIENYISKLKEKYKKLSDNNKG